MGERIRTFYSYHKELKNDECIRLYVAEGSIGGVLSRFRGSNTAMAVMCRGAKKNETMVESVTKEFCRWFQEDLPKILCHFSFDIVFRYWEEILARFSLDVESSSKVAQIEIALLFICDGKYVFCGNGELSVYEYISQQKRIKKWLTEKERKRRAWQLGTKSEDKENEKYRLRKISENSIFCICSEPFPLENLRSISSQRKWKKYIKQVGARSSGLLVVEVRKTGRVFKK